MDKLTPLYLQRTHPIFVKNLAFEVIVNLMHIMVDYTFPPAEAREIKLQGYYSPNAFHIQLSDKLGMAHIIFVDAQNLIKQAIRMPE